MRPWSSFGARCTSKGTRTILCLDWRRHRRARGQPVFSTTTGCWPSPWDLTKIPSSQAADAEGRRAAPPPGRDARRRRTGGRTASTLPCPPPTKAYADPLFRRPGPALHGVFRPPGAPAAKPPLPRRAWLKTLIPAHRPSSPALAIGVAVAAQTPAPAVEQRRLQWRRGEPAAAWLSRAARSDPPPQTMLPARPRRAGAATKPQQREAGRRRARARWRRAGRALRRHRGRQGVHPSPGKQQRFTVVRTLKGDAGEDAPSLRVVSLPCQRPAPCTSCSCDPVRIAGTSAATPALTP